MKRSRSGLTACLLPFVLLSACTKKIPAKADSSATGNQKGVASWYGRPFDGRQTANQEIYDMEKLTAAHRTLPFGTVVHITNQTNGKSVDVRINDRGPFVANRIIDLSHAAAQTIAMPSIATVDLQIVSKPHSRGIQSFAVQVGEFEQRSDAETFSQKLQAQGNNVQLIYRSRDQTWRAIVGNFSTPEAAAPLSDRLEKSFGPAFIVASDTE
jgi:rare lipoprotein A